MSLSLPCRLLACHSLPFLRSRGLAASASTSKVDVDSSLVLAYLDKVKAKAELVSSSPRPSQKEITILQRYKALQPHIEALQAVEEERTELKGTSRTSEDAELKEAAQAELNGLEEQFTEAFVAAVTVLLPAEDYDSSDAVIEVVPGAGGIEAGIFAQEIFDMYVAYTRSLGNNVEVTEYNASRVSGASNSSSKSLTGISRASATITGVGVFRALKFETGVHRVQRVPVTSTRLQTSTCSVAVLPQPDLETFPIPKSDLKAEFMRSSGPGGQSVQTMNSAVRLTHLPTGTAVECQEGKSQMRNQEKALEKLKSILYQKKFSEELSMMQKSRKSQIGNMDRNEKVRTYNFTRNMITDHRIGESRQINLSQFFAGSAGFKPVEDFYTLLVGVTDRERLHFVLKSEP